MMPIEDNTRTLTFIPLIAERPALVKEMRRKSQLSFKGMLALLLCFLLGVAAAAVLLYSFF
jgi:hypothetical protein